MLYIFRWIWGLIFILIGGFGYSYRRYFIFIWTLFAFIVWLYFGYAKENTYNIWMLMPALVFAVPSLILRFILIPNGFVKSSYYFGLISTYYNRQDIKGGALLSSVLAYQKQKDVSNKQLESWLLSKFESGKEPKWTSYLAVFLLYRIKGREIKSFTLSNKYTEYTQMTAQAEKLTQSLDKKESFVQLNKNSINDLRASYKKIMSSINSSSINNLEFLLEINRYFLLYDSLDEEVQKSFVVSNAGKIKELSNTLWENGYSFFAKILITWLMNKLPNSIEENLKGANSAQCHWYYWVRVLSSRVDGVNWVEVLKAAHKFLN